MATARLYVDGEGWEIVGNITDNFLPYTNTLEASRSGRIYATTEPKPRTVTVDDIKVELDEFEDVVDFLESCKASNNRFAMTVAIGEDCDDGFMEYHYIGCLISGDPSFSLFERKISGFEVGYEQRIIKEN